MPTQADVQAVVDALADGPLSADEIGAQLPEAGRGRALRTLAHLTKLAIVRPVRQRTPS